MCKGNFTSKEIILKKVQKLANIWATFVRKFLAKTFQNQPNLDLVTLRCARYHVLSVVLLKEFQVDRSTRGC